jgi:hypothetical protein
VDPNARQRNSKPYLDSILESSDSSDQRRRQDEEPTIWRDNWSQEELENKLSAILKIDEITSKAAWDTPVFLTANSILDHYLNLNVDSLNAREFLLSALASLHLALMLSEFDEVDFWSELGYPTADLFSKSKEIIRRVWTSQYVPFPNPHCPIKILAGKYYIGEIDQLTLWDSIRRLIELTKKFPIASTGEELVSLVLREVRQK